ncbi:putative glycerol-3-phosphate transporter 4 [Ananas comosus]|uniref:Glycerol-3-phosphate transporter 4 n=1 Tax=Ananas comosus TaxID=4615 RepID=A0A6P5ENB6_ANACO|nr:putative glycerol-3-phosphate transporter 4 [Ananas comosus]
MAPPCPPTALNFSREDAIGRNAHRGLVLALTFVAYACYHASRKPTSIVKSVLDPEPPPPSPDSSAPLSRHSPSSLPWPLGPLFLPSPSNPNPLDRSRPKGWAPFDGPDGTAKLGEIDVAFLACYSLGMYGAGHLGDRLDLRLFLSAGMIGSGAFVALFGIGYFWRVHCFAYYLAMQMLAGLLQATGWPSVVAVVGNWFGGRKRGLIMGIWNAHTSVGNIGGSLLAASVLQYGWGWSFILPGALIAFGGLLVYFFLAPYPEDLGFSLPRREEEEEGGRDDEEGPGGDRGKGERGGAVGIVKAFLIPGVIPFALCLFFSKLVAYTFLYWLPFYLSQTAIGGEYMSVKSAGNLSTLFDVGGIIGGILAGYISDQLNARATTAATFMYFAIPALYAYHAYGSISQSTNIILMMIAGLFVNGPYALITTAVSADLGTHKSLRGDSRALATVTAIIDGTGSVGAALGPLLTGFMSRSGWCAVFKMLMVGAFIAGMLLSVLVKAELAQIFHHRINPSNDRLNGAEGSVVTPLLVEGNQPQYLCSNRYSQVGPANAARTCNEWQRQHARLSTEW